MIATKTTIIIGRFVDMFDTSLVTWMLAQTGEDGQTYKGYVTSRVDEPTPPVFETWLSQDGWEEIAPPYPIIGDVKMWRKVVNTLKQPPGAYIPDATAN